MSRKRPLLLPVGIASAALAIAPAATAQEEPTEPPPPTRAQALFDEALRLTDEGQHSDACSKFRESQAAEPSVGTLLNVANCSVREGKLIIARTEYRKVQELNQTTSDAVRKERIAQSTAKGLSEIQARLAEVTLQVRPAHAKPTLRLKGSDRQPKPGLPMELEAGAYVVEVAAEGFESQLVSLQVVGGKPQHKSIELSALPAAEPRPGPVDSASSGLLHAGLVTGVSAIAVSVVGAVLLGLAGDKAAAIRTECGNDVAPPACPRGSHEVASELASEGRALEVGGYTLLGVGGAAVATSVILLVLDSTSDPARPQLGMVSQNGEVGVWLSGSF